VFPTENISNKESHSWLPPFTSTTIWSLISHGSRKKRTSFEAVLQVALLFFFIFLEQAKKKNHTHGFLPSLLLFGA